MPNEWFDEAYYITQKVAQMNATGYTGRTGTAGVAWTAESANAERAAFNVSWLQNFNACNGDGYVSSINAAALNVSPNELFNVGEYAQSVANYYNSSSFQGRTDWTANQVINYLANTGHTSLWDHYTNTGAALGLNPSNAFSTTLWADAQAASTGQTPEAILAALKVAGENPLMAYFTGGGTVEGAEQYAVPADQQVQVADGFNAWAVVPVTPGTPGGDEPPANVTYDETIYLTADQDNFTGAADKNTLFIASEFDGVNTLQSGDVIKGGGGQNMLEADVTAGNTFGQLINTVRPTVEGVQVIKFTSEQSTDNVHGQQVEAGVRADRISGAQQIWSSDSRATLVVDDVRINSTAMTVGWQNADNANNAANDMDYVLRYNNQNLVADDPTTQGRLVLKLLDQVGAAQNPSQPLLNNIYNGVRFEYDGRAVDLQFELIDGASTYEELCDAINAALKANSITGPAGIEATVGPSFQIYTAEGVLVSGNEIILQAPNGSLEEIASNAWSTADGQPAHSDVYADIAASNPTVCPLIETRIDLDNVGMVNWNDANDCIPNDQQFGDYAGDMIVGGMGNGKYVGVQRFDAVVDRGSWLSSLQSTNDALRAIIVTNGDLNGDGKAGTSQQRAGSATDLGNLFVGDGIRLENNGVAGDSLMFEGRDGLLADAQRAVNPQHVGQTVESGIMDVAVFDANAMQGKANIAAAITELSSKKYLGDTDQVDALGNKFSPSQAFSYKFGSNDDTVNMSINGNVAADNDFSLTIDMGNGNNSVHTEFANTWNLKSQNWMHEQWQNNNVLITSGSGDDIINPWGTGRVNVQAGAGNDVVYSDNSGIGADPEVTLVAAKPDNFDSMSPAAQKAYTDEVTSAVTAFTSDPIAGVGAVWLVNAQDKSGLIVKDGDFQIVPYGNNAVSYADQTFTNSAVNMGNGNIVRVTATVTYKGLTATWSVNQIAQPTGNGQGTVSITTHELNQLVLDAINNEYTQNSGSVPNWMHSILSAQEGAGNSLMLISKVDGVQADTGVGISFKAEQVSGSTVTPLTLSASVANTETAAIDLSSLYSNTTNRGPELATAYLLNEDNQLVKEDKSGDTTTDLDEAVHIKVGGNISLAEADNTIDLGTGYNLAVLSTGENSNQTIVLDGGIDTILNFDVTGKGQDFLDVSEILGANPASATYVVQSGTVANADTGLKSLSGADEAHRAYAISYITNVDPTNPNWINTAADLAESINSNVTDNPTFLNALFMVHNPNETDFALYKAEFDGAGGVTVTEWGRVNFADLTWTTYQTAINTIGVSQLDASFNTATENDAGLGGPADPSA